MMQTAENWVWEQMFDKLPFGAILISAVDEPVAMVNDRFCEITESKRSDLLQLKPSEIQVLSNLSFQQILQSLIYDPTSTLSRESYFIRQDGRQVHVAMSISLLEPPHETGHRGSCAAWNPGPCRRGRLCRRSSRMTSCWH